MGAGLSIGLLLGERVEWRGRRILTQHLPSRNGRRPAATASVTAIRRALADHDDFEALDVTVRPVTPGVVELCGWVDDRQSRARLVHFTRTFPGIDDVHDRLLVHGEDDLHRDGPSSQSRATS